MYTILEKLKNYILITPFDPTLEWILKFILCLDVIVKS